MALVSKPGITGASAKLAIPKEWDQNWFRSFISNYLQGADVRNAVSSGGLSISGTIASPYATLGFSPPVTLPGQVIITPPTISQATTPALLVQGTSTQGEGYLEIKNVTTGVLCAAIGGGVTVTGQGVNDLAIWTNSNNLVVGVGNGSVIDLQIGGTAAAPTFKMLGPNNGGLVDFSFDTGTFTGTLTGLTTSPTVNCAWLRLGRCYVLIINYTNAAVTGTSNSSGFTMTGVPAAIQSATVNSAGTSLFSLENNGSSVSGTAFLPAASGTVTFFNGTSGSGSSWTASGTKGIVSPITIVGNLL